MLDWNFIIIKSEIWQIINGDWLLLKITDSNESKQYFVVQGSSAFWIIIIWTFYTSSGL